MSFSVVAPTQQAATIHDNIWSPWNYVGIRIDHVLTVTPALIHHIPSSLIGGATFHMMPCAVDKMGNGSKVYIWLNAGCRLPLLLMNFYIGIIPAPIHTNVTHTHMITNILVCHWQVLTASTSSASTKDETDPKKESYDEEKAELEVKDGSINIEIPQTEIQS